MNNTATKTSPATKEKLAAWHAESFFVDGTIEIYSGEEPAGTAWSKIKQSTGAFRKLRLVNKAGTSYTLAVFSDQEPEIWALGEAQPGDRITAYIHPVFYGPRFDGCYRVVSVADSTAVDSVKAAAANKARLEAMAMLQGISADTFMSGLLSVIAQTSSQAWKLHQMPSSATRVV